MNIINEFEQKSERYLPHDLNTKYYAVISYRNGNIATYVCRKYHNLKLLYLDGIEDLMVIKNH